MKIVDTLMVRNRSWAKQQKRRNADYFLNHIRGQQPVALWIGCSDSRVPAEVLTCAQPGELFVHRNIANMVLAEDDSLMSVLEYALGDLHISTIVLCGHYGCGGVRAALAIPPENHSACSALPRRLSILRDSLHQPADVECDSDRLIETHVRIQMTNLLNCRPVRQAATQGKALDIYGCVYDLRSGHLKQLVHQHQGAEG